MKDPRQQHGNHSWDIIIDYHCCPQCGFIMENREKYQKRSNVYQKDVLCDRCHHAFIITHSRDPEKIRLIDD